MPSTNGRTANASDDAAMDLLFEPGQGMKVLYHNAERREGGIMEST